MPRLTNDEASRARRGSAGGEGGQIDMKIDVVGRDTHLAGTGSVPSRRSGAPECDIRLAQCTVTTSNEITKIFHCLYYIILLYLCIMFAFLLF